MKASVERIHLRKEVIELLEQNFPWLIKPEESVSGADVIDALVELHSRLKGQGLLGRVIQQDAEIDDKAHDGAGARPPDGDDYSELHSDVVATLSDIRLSSALGDLDGFISNEIAARGAGSNEWEAARDALASLKTVCLMLGVSYVDH